MRHQREAMRHQGTTTDIRLIVALLAFAACEARDEPVSLDDDEAEEDYELEYSLWHARFVTPIETPLRSGDRVIDAQFIVEGDLLARNEDEVRAYFDGQGYASRDPMSEDPSGSLAFRATAAYFAGTQNSDARWHRTDQLNLSYCVANEFGGDKARVLAEMRRQTRKWEQVAYVNFIYLPQYDAACDLDAGDQNPVPRIYVRPGDASDGLEEDVNAKAFFPINWAASLDDPEHGRSLFFTQLGLSQDDPDFGGTVLHELGHVLGLRHEHIHDSCTGEVSEVAPGLPFNARDLTPNDRASVMYYDWCPDALDDNNTLSRHDVIGIKNMYNDPRSFWEGFHSGFDNRTDYNGDGRADILFFGGTILAGVNNVWYGTAGGGFEQHTADWNLPTHARAIAGRFHGADSRTDVLFYTQGNGLVGSTQDYLRGGTATKGVFSTGPAPTVNETYQPLVGDFIGPNGVVDGYTDILWYRPGTHDDWLWQGNSNGIFTVWPLTIDGYYHPLVAKLNCDNISDILWYDPLANNSPVWIGTGSSSFGQWTVTTKGGNGLANPANPWEDPVIPIVGQFDGAGPADIFWYAPSVGVADTFWRSSCQSVVAAATLMYTTIEEWKPFTGDFNGDGITDIFWFGEDNVPDVIWLMGGPPPSYISQAVNVNASFDRSPIVGDFDGDGDTDILWFRPEQSTSRLWRFSGTGGLTFTDSSIPNPLNEPYFPVGYGTNY